MMKYMMTAFCFISYSAASWADIVLDGSMGSTLSLEAPAFTVDESVGQLRGTNLFHSFSEFNLNKEQSVNFTGSSNISNIIARITSGSESIIDGTISSKISDANLFLLNPAGFIFGPNARLNLSGNFLISTASNVQFADGTQLSTRFTEQPLLTAADPVAFGFLSLPTENSVIEIQRSNLAAPAGKRLMMSAGRIELNGARLLAIGGRIDLVGVQQTASLQNLGENLVLAADTLLGDINMTNNASADVGKQVAGNIYIRAGQFMMDSSEIIANTDENNDGGEISIEAETFTMLNQSLIDSRTLGLGTGGNIHINVTGNATLSNSNILTTSRNTRDADAGNAGDIKLTAGNLNLVNSMITADTFGSGRGGNITLSVQHALNLSSVVDSAMTANLFSAIQASSRSTADSAGKAGNITIEAESLNLNGSQTTIENNTLGSGGAGSIVLLIDDIVTLKNDASITSEGRGGGDAGSILLKTKILDLSSSSISTEAAEARGGNVILGVSQQMTLQNSNISATVRNGIGNGGNVLISPPYQLHLIDSKLLANANQGRGGLILIVSGQAMENQGSSITATSSAGLDGKVRIELPNVDFSKLPITFLDASELIQERCEVRNDEELSSFIVTGRRGLPNAPDDLQPYLPSLKRLLEILK